MKFKIGDKVRIKSWGEIAKTLDNYYYEDMYFNPVMQEFCGKEITLIDNNKSLYDFRNTISDEIHRSWYWAEEWLEPIETTEKKEKEPMKMEKVVVVRGMNEQQIRKYLGALAKSIETVEMPRSVKAICRDIFAKRQDEVTSFLFKDNVTVAVTRDGHVGVARLRAGDIYSMDVGRALARARALRFKALEKELLAAL